MTATDNTPIPAYADLLRLEGRGFVVVGAGQGMGRHSAHALAQQGAQVVCVDIEEARAKDIAAEIGTGIPCVADARTREGAASIIDVATRELDDFYGVVDIVGMARYSRLIDTTDEEWDWTFDMVLRHAFYMVQLGGRELAARGRGTIVLISSISGIVSAPSHGAYGAAKAGIINMVRTAAVELGPSGVRVNSVAPGATDTPRILAARAEGTALSTGPAIEPLGESGKTSDIASAVLFFASDLSRHITGQTLTCDGGALCLYPYPMANR